MFIARAVCGVTHVTIAALFCISSSLLCISNSDWATENEAGRSVSVNGNEEPAVEICHQYSSVVTAIIPFSRTIKLQYTLLGDYWECVRPARLPVLTWVPSTVPPGNNIQDTFLIRSATDTTDQMLVGVDTMKIEACFVCRKNWRKEMKLRRRNLRTMHWRSQLFYSGWRELLYFFESLR